MEIFSFFLKMGEKPVSFFLYTILGSFIFIDVERSVASK